MVLRILFVILLLLVGTIDFRTRRIPDRLVICLFALGVITAGDEWNNGVCGLTGRLIGLFTASLPLFCIDLLWPGAFGGGDIKLLAAGGFFLGVSEILQALGIGIILAGVFCASGLLSGRMEKDSRFALGPFLCAGMIVCCLF